jgi:hypothetical protein
MAKIGSLCERVQTPYSKGVASDDTRLSNRYTYSVLISIRKMLVAQQIKKRQKISDWNYITLDCIEMIPVESHECSCFVGPSCQIFRSRYALPKILTDMNNHMIEFISSIDGQKIISLTDRKGDLYSSGNKYTSKKHRAVIENGYLYGFSEDFPQMLKMKFLPEDPLEAALFQEACSNSDNSCMSMLDREFPIDGDMEKALVDLASQEILSVVFLQRTEDNRNNGSDDSGNELGSPRRK